MRPALLFLPIKGSSVVLGSDAGEFLRQTCETTKFLAKKMCLSGCSKMTLESWLSLLKSLAQPMRRLGACMPACLLACLPACLPACLRQVADSCALCLPACLPACLFAC